MKKLSFFERLTGTIRMQDDEPENRIHDLDQDLDVDQPVHESKLSRLQKISSAQSDDYGDTDMDQEEAEAELAVDVFYNDREIVIQTMTAGIKKEHLEIILSREEITGLRKGKKAESTFTLALKEWEESEKKSTKPSSDLNWIRVLNPWILREDFPSRTAFESCAGELRTLMDVGITGEGIKEWTECLDLIYTAEVPPEFMRLRKCLESRF